VAEGLASVRGGGPEVAKLQELEAQAKAAGKGIWSTDDRSAVRIPFTVCHVLISKLGLTYVNQKIIKHSTLLPTEHVPKVYLDSAIYMYYF
jgi:hypothetical protein